MKSTVIWLVLLAAVIAVYRLADVSSGDGGLSWLGPAVLLFIVGVFVVQSQRANRVLEHALAQLDTGHSVAALATLDKGPRGALLDAYRGYAKLTLWQLDEARPLLSSALSSTGNQHVHAFAPSVLELVSALRNQPVNVGVPLARAVLRVRERKWDEALSLLSGAQFDRSWERSLANALRAWAASEKTREVQPIDVAQLLGETHVDSVRKYWPEFAVFLEQGAARER